VGGDKAGLISGTKESCCERSSGLFGEYSRGFWKDCRRTGPMQASEHSWRANEATAATSSLGFRGMKAKGGLVIANEGKGKGIEGLQSSLAKRKNYDWCTLAVRTVRTESRASFRESRAKKLTALLQKALRQPLGRRATGVAPHQKGERTKSTGTASPSDKWEDRRRERVLGGSRTSEVAPSLQKGQRKTSFLDIKCEGEPGQIITMARRP